MKYKFSDKLIKEFQCYMKNKCNADLTKEECDQYLGSLASLYRALTE